MFVDLPRNALCYNICLGFLLAKMHITHMIIVKMRYCKIKLFKHMLTKTQCSDITKTCLVCFFVSEINCNQRIDFRTYCMIVQIVFCTCDVILQPPLCYVNGSLYIRRNNTQIPGKCKNRTPRIDFITSTVAKMTHITRKPVQTNTHTHPRITASARARALPCTHVSLHARMRARRG